MVENKRISESSVPENGKRSFENDKIDDTFVNVVDEDYLSWLPAPVRAYSFGYCLLALNHRSGIIIRTIQIAPLGVDALEWCREFLSSKMADWSNLKGDVEFNSDASYVCLATKQILCHSKFSYLPTDIHQHLTVSL
jgi:hypothetical protein